MAQYLVIVGIATAVAVGSMACWQALQLLRQNGRILIRLDVLEEAVREHGDNGPAESRNGHSNGRNLEESHIRRDGLPAGTPAPEFRLPLLTGGDMSLEDYRGRRVLLVFSDPHCGPCDALAPQLERRSRETLDVQVLMVSRGDESDNCKKAREHGLTFPIALQKKWEVSKLYAMFATPIAYMIDEQGVTMSEVAVGGETILSLISVREAALAR